MAALNSSFSRFAALPPRGQGRRELHLGALQARRRPRLGRNSSYAFSIKRKRWHKFQNEQFGFQEVAPSFPEYSTTEKLRKLIWPRVNNSDFKGKRGQSHLQVCERAARGG